MAEQTQSASCLQLKACALTMTLLELYYYDYRDFNRQLAELVKQAPRFFQQAPVVINLDKLKQDHEAVDFIELVQLCQAYGLHPIAIKGGDEKQHMAATAASLPQIPSSKSSRSKKSTIESGATSSKIELEPMANSDNLEYSRQGQELETAFETDEITTLDVEVKPRSRVVTTPIRSGQQVYAQGGDLIVLAPVSAGAEILADGHIHVYAPLRGRALAGVNGNTEARIFCQKLEAELLSIAGHYKISEDLRRFCWQKPIHAQLMGSQLSIVTAYAQ